jgi:hypothetical protein
VAYVQYPYSSAKFFETGVDEFGILQNIFAVLYGEEKERGIVRVPRTKAEGGNSTFYRALIGWL